MARIRRAAGALRRHPAIGRTVEESDFDLREVLAPFGRGAYVLRPRWVRAAAARTAAA